MLSKTFILLRKELLKVIRFTIHVALKISHKIIHSHNQNPKFTITISFTLKTQTQN